MKRRQPFTYVMHIRVDDKSRSTAVGQWQPQRAVLDGPRPADLSDVSDSDASTGYSTTGSAVCDGGPRWLQWGQPIVGCRKSAEGMAV
jgi:hypothetical protein